MTPFPASWHARIPSIQILALNDLLTDGVLGIGKYQLQKERQKCHNQSFLLESGLIVLTKNIADMCLIVFQNPR